MSKPLLRGVMRVTKHLLRGVAVAIAFCASANALSQVWVSSQGVDVGTCGAASNPCKTFQFAVGRTSAGGEIDIKDPGDFGPVTITKSLSIVNHTGGTAAIGTSAAGQTAIIVGAGASDVYLHGLTLNGFGKGLTGILLSGNGKLMVVDCVVQGFANGFISSHVDSTVSIKKSIFRGNSNFGARLVSNKTEIKDASFSKSIYGLAVGSAATVGKNSSAMITNSDFFENTFGIVFAATNAAIGANKIFRNATGISNSTAMPPNVRTFQDNYIALNGTDVTGNLTSTSLK